MEVRSITYQKTVALVFRKGIKADGVKFLTPPAYTLQLGLIEHPVGKVVKNHIHRKDIKYNVDTTQEFLYIVKGRVKVHLFSDDWEPLEDVILTAGDFILMVSGGHGLEVLEKCKIVEVKQGPYPGDKEAKTYDNER